jgi:hypothetical protein
VRDARLVLDAYIRLAQEAAEDVGFISGLIAYRHLRWEAAEAEPPVQAIDEERAAA